MPEVGPDKQTAVTYPPDSLYQSWADHAKELDMSVSQFIISMVEAGRKQIQLDDAATSSVHDLRQQRDDLREELKRERKRVRELERQLHRSATTEIDSFVSNNPGATTPEIMQHVADTVPGRVASYLDLLEGDTLEQREDGYYLLDTDSPEKTHNETETPSGLDDE